MAGRPNNPVMRTSAGARYDLLALRPPAPGSGLTAPDAEAAQVLRALQHWCLAGSGPGGCPWWRPRAMPAVQTRLAVAHLDIAARAGDGTPQRLTAQLMLERDGSLQLQARRTAAGRLALRARTKVHDLMWWRARQPSDPWDSGYVRDSAGGLQALTRFQPRRATLLVVDRLEGLADDALVALWLDLRARQHRFAHPVRLLVLGPLPPALQAAGGITRLPLRRASS